MNRRQRKRQRERERDAEFLAKMPSTSGVNPKDTRQQNLVPRKLRKKASVSFTRHLDLHREKAILSARGEGEEASLKKEEADKMKERAIRQATLSQEVETANHIAAGKEPPEQKGSLQIIYDRGFKSSLQMSGDNVEARTTT